MVWVFFTSTSFVHQPWPIGAHKQGSRTGGALAHELGHEPKSTTEHFQQCVFAARYLPVRRSLRESERVATQRAIGYMKASRYDPSACWILFSQVSMRTRGGRRRLSARIY